MSDEMETPETVRLLIDWSVPDDLPTHYVTNLVSQHTKHEFFITFFEIIPPLTLGRTAEEVESMESVRARALTRISVSPERLQGFINALQENLEQYRASLKTEDMED
jgi:hypothetical protein